MKISARHSLLWVVAALFLGAFQAGAAEAHWLTDYDKAVAQAKATHRPLLMDFTGSDWCPFCIQMEKDVFTKSQFTEYADKNVVLLRLDFPQGHQLPAKLQDQNNTLQEKYGVEGMPTFILIDESGKVLASHVGYLDGGPAAFIDFLQGKKS